MTSSPPPDPRSSEREPLGFDEFIGIFVALTTIGAVLFWALSQGNQDFSLTSLVFPSPSPAAQPTQTPSLGTTASPTLVSPVPTVGATGSPEVLLPVPLQSPIVGQIQTPFAGRLPTVVPVPIRPPVTPAPQTPAPPRPINFLDVPQDFWARPFIDALSARGIVAGFAGDYFRPERPVTRAEFAAILQDAFDQTPGQRTTVFNDVPANFWAVPSIESATRNGFLKGYPGNVFQPQQQIPRAQVLVALATGLNLPTPASPTQTLQVYGDAAQIPRYAIDKAAAATEAGLVVNYPDQKLLAPNRNATRAEVAAIIYQALARAGKVQPIQSQYVVRANP